MRKPACSDLRGAGVPARRFPGFAWPIKIPQSRRAGTPAPLDPALVFAGAALSIADALLPMIRFAPAGLPRLVLSVAASVATAFAAQPKISYNQHIQPILAENCFSCHGPDSSARKGKLRLDRAEFATQPRGDGDLEAAIKPGNPKESPLVERITSTDSEERMPPFESHKTLKPAEIGLLQRWIVEGAKYEEHWSLIAPVRPAVPVVSIAKRWARNPIDHFVAEKLAEAKLKPGREESAARLFRRLTFDLTGLPPTPAELAAFVGDRSPEAYERAVDRLLATDASAEQFARHWLDAVRYADTHGIHIDNYRSIWPYRDWVVGAYRSNLPFDQFTIEQVAGDLLPNATLDQKVASGFNRCLPTTSEGGAIPAEYEAIYAKDRVETVSAVWLGLTTGCAACHDHKFDPVSQKDFYALTAFFRNNTMPAMDGNVSDTPPTIFVPAAGDRERWNALQAEITAGKQALAARSKGAEQDFERWLSEAKALVAPPLDRNVRQWLALSEESGPLKIASASASGADPERTDGIYGPAPRIDERDLVIGKPVAWMREGAESFGFLLRIDETPSGTLLSCKGEDPKSAGWELFLEAGKIGVHVTDDGGLVNARGVAKTAIEPGAWHHVLLTFDAASMRSRNVDVYVNGKAAANSGMSAHMPADIMPQAPLRLGSRHGTDGKPVAMLKGGDVWVQDLRHYGRGFLLAEAKELSDVVETHAALKVAPEMRTAAQKKLLRTQYVTSVDRPAMELAAKLDRLLAEDAILRSRGGVTLVMEEKRDSEPVAHILNRGEYAQLGEKVSAATPAALPPLPTGAPRNRLGLARWLVSVENPLTARVTVNRAWQQFFGTGIVESSGDFGVTGSTPSHAALLDWLAVEFRESGWDYRRLVRLIVTSATYRQAAAVTPKLLERDPANRLLARGPRYRLEAEELRDQALAVSGLLVPKLGGRPVRPYQPEGIWEEIAMKESTTRFYRPETDENLYRRSLYTFWKRIAPNPAMDILNAPSREVTCVRRDRTNTPLQALVTLNEPLFVEASRQLAARVLREAPSVDARLDAISLRLLGRKFIRAERAVVRRTLDDARATYRRDGAAAKALLTVGASKVDASLPQPELAAWTIVASQVMNLDEALTK
jgi:mono/diheme cytochrome c family protein